MNKYLLLIKSTTHLDYSPEKYQKRMDEYREWLTTIADHYISSNRLERTGAHIHSQNEVITDGPFLDVKESIAGFIMLKANDLDQAIKISLSCPLLKYFEIMVRPMIEED
ncbi:MAG: YciI family protein [Bacteroidota bacterium]